MDTLAAAKPAARAAFRQRVNSAWETVDLAVIGLVCVAADEPFKQFERLKRPAFVESLHIGSTGPSIGHHLEKRLKRQSHDEFVATVFKKSPVSRREVVVLKDRLEGRFPLIKLPTREVVQLLNRLLPKQPDEVRVEADGAELRANGIGPPFFAVRGGQGRGGIVFRLGISLSFI